MIPLVRVGAACTVFVAASLGLSGVAGADPAPDPAIPTTTPAIPALTDVAATTAVDLTRTVDKLEDVDRQLAVAQAHLVAAQAVLNDTDDKIAENQGKIAVVKARVRTRAVAAYQHGGGGNNEVLTIGSVADLKSAEQYASNALDVDGTELANLTALQRDLNHDREQRIQQSAEIAGSKAKLDDSRAQLVELRDREQALLDRWGAVPVMGGAWLSANELAGWFASTGAAPRLAPGTTVEDLARLYLIEGNAEHVRGDIAFAQAIIETGSFGVAAGNNYSGIGVCDSCTGGYGFPTPLDGVRAQIQLLRSYADPDSRASNLSSPPSPGLYGSDPARAATLYDSFFLKGKAPLWNGMGNGNWATDPTYARKVIELFARMVAYASAQRTAQAAR